MLLHLKHGWINFGRTKQLNTVWFYSRFDWNRKTIRRSYKLIVVVCCCALRTASMRRILHSMIISKTGTSTPQSSMEIHTLEIIALNSYLSDFVVLCWSINQSINLRLLAACQNASQQCTISKTHIIVQKFKSYVPNICLCTTFVWWSWSLTSVWCVMATVVSVCDVWGCISAMQRTEEVLVHGGHG